MNVFEISGRVEVNQTIVLATYELGQPDESKDQEVPFKVISIERNEKEQVVSAAGLAFFGSQTERSAKLSLDPTADLTKALHSFPVGELELLP